MADGLFLNLAYALAGESVFVAYLFEGHFGLSDTIEGGDDGTLAVVERLKEDGNFVTERLHNQLAVGHRGIVVDKHVEQAVVFAIDEGRIYGDVACTSHHGFIDLVFREVDTLRNLIG